MSSVRTTALALFLITTIASADTIIQPGFVSGEWTAAGSPYMILGDIQVVDSLIIGPGVVIQLEGPYRIIVWGEFRANGEAGDSIRFTCDTARTPGWNGLLFRESPDTAQIRYTVVENAHYDSGPHEYHAGTGVAVVLGASLNARHSRLSHNDGGLCVEYGVYVNLENCEISYNTTETGGLSGVRMYSAGTIRMSSCSIHHNHALDGGGLFIGSGEVVLDSCNIFENQGGIWGGGAFFDQFTRLSADRCVFHNNETGFTGGGIDFYGSDLRMNGCIISSNHVGLSGNGGGVRLRGEQHLLVRCTFAGNYDNGQTADLDCGSNVVLNSCIFAADNADPRVRFMYADAAVTHCDFSGNLAGNLPENLGELDRVNANGDSCDPYDNIFADPMFVDLGQFDLHLQENSPCIDAGDPDLPLDPDTTLADIGAFYRHHSPNAIDERAIPAGDFTLRPPYPNPFNASTVLTFELTSERNITLSVFDVLGRHVVLLASGHLSAGPHHVLWNAEAFASGVYFAVLSDGSRAQIQKLLLIR